MLNNHLFIVMAIEHYNPLGLIRSLGEKGINPIYIAIKGKVQLASKSKYIAECHYVDSVEEGYQILISEYGNYDNAHRPILYCCDDKTMGYLDHHFDDLNKRFIYFNAGEKDRINKYIDKFEILKLAEDCGLELAHTEVCSKGEIYENIVYPIITKSISPNIGGWKSDVFICRNEQELKAAYQKIQSPKVLLQSYIEKKNELEYYGISVNHGEDILFSVATDYLYLIPGYYSPYMNVFQPPFPDVQAKIADMIKKIGFEGIFSCEFIVAPDDKLYFLEINFRNATWSYSSTYAGINLPYLWAEGMVNGSINRNEIGKFSAFKSMVEPIDYSKRVKTNKISLAEWMKDFKQVENGYYFNPDDLQPWEICVENWDLLG